MHMKSNEGMTKRRFQLSEGETRQLRAQEQQRGNVAEFKRLQAVRLYGCGQSMAAIKDMTGCAESSIREWVQDYKREGLSALRGHYEQSAHNASKLSQGQHADLQERLHAYRPDQVLSPMIRVSQGTFWAVSDLHIALEAWYGVVYQDAEAYQQLFHHCGFSYQRAERVYKSRPS